MRSALLIVAMLVACQGGGGALAPDATGSPSGSLGGSHSDSAPGSASGSASISGSGSAAGGGSGTGTGAGTGTGGGTFLLIGQSGRRAHLDFVLGTGSVPAGGSIYAELYTGKVLSFEQGAVADYLEQHFPGSLVEVGLSWKDNRVSAGYCDLGSPECVASGGAVEPELDIIAGKYDSQLAMLGQWMQAHAQLTFLVRVDYEVSPFMHCRPSDTDSCPAYRDAFVYLKNFWKTAGISNVQLVFHPTRGWARQLYPGADVTDWIAFSVFNHDLCLATPEGSNVACGATEQLDPNLAADLAWAEAQDKPILIAEATVQSPSDASAAGFNGYLERLFGLISARPAVRGLTYINMKWSGGWVYGENWTQGAFGNVDARIARFPETRAFFCDELAAGQYRGFGASVSGCDQLQAFPAALPHSFDAPGYERLVVLGSNQCLMTSGTGGRAGAPLVAGDCSKLADSGRGRFHIDSGGAGAQIWSDLSWQCWSGEGDAVVERPCAGLPSQVFYGAEAVGGPGSVDVRLVASDGRCVSAAPEAAAGQALILAACSDSPLQIIRL